MKTLATTTPRLIFIYGLILLTFNSCQNEIEVTEILDIREEAYKQKLLENKSVVKIRELNFDLLKKVENELATKSKKTKDFTNLSPEEFYELYKNSSFFKEYSSLMEFHIKELIFSNPELLQSEEDAIKYFKNLFTYNNLFAKQQTDCQKEFEKEISKIHGEYDARIIGAAIGLMYSKGSAWPLSLGVALFAVSDATYSSAKAIDNYNECLRKQRKP